LNIISRDGQPVPRSTLVFEESSSEDEEGEEEVEEEVSE